MSNAALALVPVQKPGCIMVCLYLPPEVSATLAIPGGEAPEDLHCTLCIVPDAGQNQQIFNKVVSAANFVAAQFAPLQAWIGGSGLFNGSPSSDNKDVFYASLNAPGLPALREALIGALLGLSVEPGYNHGFTPHVTLKYLNVGEAPPLGRLETAPFAMPALSVASRSIDAVHAPMNGQRVLKSDPGGSSVHVPSTQWSKKKPKVSPLKKQTVQAPEAPSDQDLGLQNLIAGMDWELADGGGTDDDCLNRALVNLGANPEHYRDLVGGNTNDAAPGWNLDLGSGSARQPGYVGLDVYPHDRGTIVHDVSLGVPFPDESAANVRLVNAPEIDPQHAAREAERVLQPGGQFHYEGPRELTDYPKSLVMIWHESNEGQVNKSDATPAAATFRQVFERVALPPPDPATANDAQPIWEGVPGEVKLALSALNDAAAPTLPEDVLKEMTRVFKALMADPQPVVKKARSKKTHFSLFPGSKKKSVPVDIRKADRAKQIVYGVVLEPHEVDIQDDWMRPEEIEKTAHEYLIKSRVVGANHTRAIKSVPVESYIAPQDLEWNDGQYGPQKVKKGSWVLAVKILDAEMWSKVASGEFQGFSVGGFGVRT